ncbi:MAG: electron transfer flavoprotein subunit alpha/FixB family protein [Fusobacteriaceae bacterium]
MSSNKNILVFIEIKDGKILKVSLESLGAARKIVDENGGEIVGVVIGKGIEKLAIEAIAYGSDKVITLDSEKTSKYDLDVYEEVMEQVINKYNPQMLLLGSTQYGKELAGVISQKFNSGCVNDCIDIKRDEKEGMVFTASVYGGTVLADMILDESTPQIITIRSGAFKKIEMNLEKKGEIIPEIIKLKEKDIKNKVLDVVKEISESIDLESAEVIVAGGRGMGSEENFKLLEELCKVLGGVMGATRPAIEANWISRAHQIGQSGKIVSPKLYIACGISGAVQHVSGITGSDYIVAINKDEDAPIFEVANISIVGNAMEILPTMIDGIKKIKSL